LDYQRYNDYEIIALIKEGNNDAINLMFDKYSKLISKKIFKFNLYYVYDDMFQEGQMILLNSIHKFEDRYNKTFTRYFEQNLERKYMTFINKMKRRNDIFKENINYIYESNHNVFANSHYYDILLKEIRSILTKIELEVFVLREVKNYSVKFICNKLALEDKFVYNTIHRSKAKIKAHFQD